MTDYREIHAIQKHPARARTIAQSLFNLTDIEWTDWELDFLEHMTTQQDELSTRQGEKLVELRDASMWYSAVDGFSLKTLIDKCYRYRCDLDEHDEEFIVGLKEAGMIKLRRKSARRLLRCARILGELEPHHGRSLDVVSEEA